MRVLFITSSYPANLGDPRGIFIHELARALVAEGVELTVLAPAAPGAPAVEVRDGVHVRRARYWVDQGQALASGLGGIVSNLRRKPWLAFQLPSLVGALTWHAFRLARDAEIVHGHWVYPAGIAAVVSARLRGRPSVLSSHGGDLNLAVRFLPLKVLASLVARNGDACLGVSEAVVAHFITLGARPERVHLLPFGARVIDTEDNCDADSVALRQFRESDGLKVLYVGSLIPRKSVATLLAAGRELAQREKRLIIGVVGTGPELSALKALATSEPRLDVVFAGEVPPAAVSRWMRCGDVLVLPSLSEGQPNVILEAMAHRRAVIASDIPGSAGLVRHGFTGLLFTAQDVSALAGHLDRFIENPVDIRRMGDRGYEDLVDQGLSSAECARRHTRLYARLIAPPHSGPTFA